MPVHKIMYLFITCRHPNLTLELMPFEDAWMYVICHIVLHIRYSVVENKHTIFSSPFIALLLHNGSYFQLNVEVVRMCFRSWLSPQTPNLILNCQMGANLHEIYNRTMPYVSTLPNHFLNNKGHFTHKTESPWPLHFKHYHWWKWRSRSKFPSHYAWGTNWVSECEMDVKSTWIMFRVTWIISKNHLLEVGLTQNQETMALRMLTTVDLFYFIMCEDPHE
jgi:hypothetical protein